MAEELHLSLSNVKKSLERLRRKDLSRLCLECFAPCLYNGVCEGCGCEPASPDLPLEVNFDQQSPTNSLQAGSELGSEVDYRGVGFTNHWMILKRRIDSSLEGPLLRGVKSDVMNELKEYYPAAIVPDFAGKLCIKEVAEFRARYPLLAVSKNVRKQLAQNVIRRMKLLYPSLGRSNHQEGDMVTPP
jgi:hypothetical protein